MHFRRVRYAAAAAVSGLLLPALTACADDETWQTPPAATRSASESPSYRPSSAASPPTLPRAAEGTGPAAAKAFARHWADVLNYAAAAGDTEAFLGLSASTCESCVAMASRIEAVYTAGGHYEGGDLTVAHVKYQPPQPPRKPVLSLSIDLAPQTLYETATASPVGFEGGRNVFTVWLARERGAWHVRAMNRL